MDAASLHPSPLVILPSSPEFSHSRRPFPSNRDGFSDAAFHRVTGGGEAGSVSRAGVSSGAWVHPSTVQVSTVQAIPSSQAAGSATGVIRFRRHSTTVHGSLSSSEHWNPEWTHPTAGPHASVVTEIHHRIRGISRHAFPFTATFGSIARVSIFTDQGRSPCAAPSANFSRGAGVTVLASGHHRLKRTPHFRIAPVVGAGISVIALEQIPEPDPGRMHRLRSSCHRKSLRWEEGASGFGIASHRCRGCRRCTLPWFPQAGSRLARLFLRAKVPIFARGPVGHFNLLAFPGVLVASRQVIGDCRLLRRRRVHRCRNRSGMRPRGAIVAIRTRGSIREGDRHPSPGVQSSGVRGSLSSH